MNLPHGSASSIFASFRFRKHLFAGLLLICLGCNPSETALACCAVSTKVPVVNADQTVILIWDREKQTEHFIRKASFLSDGDSVGFIVPSPSRPQLEEAGDAAFPYLAWITAPEVSSGFVMPFSCAASTGSMYSPSVTVVEEKTVAGYHAVVLAADSGTALLSWLKDHDYTFTPEAAAWAQPYLDQRWYMTVMKIAKDKNNVSDPALSASALRISFKTDKPLFPYREPDSRKDAALLKTKDRTLRIYFIAEARYEGQFPSGSAWSGKPRWSQPLDPYHRRHILQDLKLPESTGPEQMWLTEFEDLWPYGQAPGDVYFVKSASQKKIADNPPLPVDPTLVLGFLLFFPLLRKKKKKC